MGDFLGNLVAKSLNLADVVMPRPVSIFEPTPKEGGPFSAPPSDLALLAPQDETPSTPAAALQPYRIPEPQPPYEGMMAPDTHHHPSPVEVPSRPSAKPPQPAPTVHEPAPAQAEPGPATPRRPEAIRPLSEPTPMAADTGSLQPSAQPSSPSARKPPDRAPASRPAAEPVARPEPVPAALEPTPPVPLTTPEPSLPPARTLPLPEIGPQEPIRDRPSRLRPVAVAEPDTVQSQSAADRQRAASPESAAPSPDQAPTPRLSTAVVVRPQIAAIPIAEPARPTPFAPGSAAETTPTIQVTIGRVEVRAVPPPPAPQKTRPRPPVMTLDEYLRQRNQGGQR